MVCFDSCPNLNSPQLCSSKCWTKIYLEWKTICEGTQNRWIQLWKDIILVLICRLVFAVVVFWPAARDSFVACIFRFITTMKYSSVSKMVLEKICLPTLCKTCTPRWRTWSQPKMVSKMYFLHIPCVSYVLWMQNVVKQDNNIQAQFSQNTWGSQ